MRRALALIAVPFLICGYFGVSLVQVWTVGRSYTTGPAEVIVVLGAAQYDGRPSPQLAARLDEVIKIWDLGTIPWVMVTGGRVGGDRFSEAEASRRYLTAAGIPESRILAEDEGATTYGSLQLVASVLRERGLQRVVLVTDPFHSLRSRLIAEELGLQAVVAPTSTSIVRGSRDLRLHVREAAGVALGRVIGFERLTALVG
jgi:uncharacterized SAM-binding protein YcdF (DUF218 family)